MCPLEATHIPVDGPTPKYIQTVLSEFSGFKDRAHKIEREMWEGANREVLGKEGMVVDLIKTHCMHA